MNPLVAKLTEATGLMQPTPMSGPVPDVEKLTDELVDPVCRAIGHQPEMIRHYVDHAYVLMVPGGRGGGIVGLVRSDNNGAIHFAPSRHVNIEKGNYGHSHH